MLSWIETSFFTPLYISNEKKGLSRKRQFLPGSNASVTCASRSNAPRAAWHQEMIS